MTRHSYSLTVVMPIFAASEFSVRSLISLLRSVPSCEARLLHGTVLCMCFSEGGGVNAAHSLVRFVLFVVGGHVG